MSKCPVDHAKKDPLAQTVVNAHAVQQQCPVIHAVNDAEAQEEGVQYETSSPFDFEEEFKNEVPSMREYKKLRRTTQMITSFYRNGSKMKEENYNTVMNDIARLDVDKQMAQEQYDDLAQRDKFKGHLKFKEVKEACLDDIERLGSERKMLEKHAQKCKDLMIWSRQIVKICEYLEVNLDNYCKEHLDLPDHIKNKVKPIPPLSKEEEAEYAKGIAEIMHNLNESRDFFQAAVDGRLDTYYELEKELCETQLAVLQKYPADNPRREMVEAQLKEDLDHAIAQLESAKEQKTITRRKFMLDMHLDFLKVLSWFKNKMGILDDGVKQEERLFSPEFTTTFVLGK